MNFHEQMKSELRAEYGETTFSFLLDSYLNLRAKGPDESSGYTDKDYYGRIDMLRELMDERVGGPK